MMEYWNDGVGKWGRVLPYAGSANHSSGVACRADGHASDRIDACSANETNRDGMGHFWEKHKAACPTLNLECSR